MARVFAITGASSGLGRALTLEYAAPGVALALIGRDANRLEEAAAKARAKGADVRVGRIDVRDRAAMSEFLLATDAATPIDCLLACAGVTMVTPTDGAVEDLTKSADLFDVNVNGVMNTLAPIAPLMRARRAGQIVLFGSIAAFAPPPDSPSYAASKAAIVAFALATTRPLSSGRCFSERDLPRLRRYADGKILRQLEAVPDRSGGCRAPDPPRP